MIQIWIMPSTQLKSQLSERVQNCNPCWPEISVERGFDIPPMVEYLDTIPHWGDVLKFAGISTPSPMGDGENVFHERVLTLASPLSAIIHATLGRVEIHATETSHASWRLLRPFCQLHESGEDAGEVFCL